MTEPPRDGDAPMFAPLKPDEQADQVQRAGETPDKSKDDWQVQRVVPEDAPEPNYRKLRPKEAEARIPRRSGTTTTPMASSPSRKSGGPRRTAARSFDR